ncbi:ribonuclease H-like domain-containing protein [Halalkalibacter kiskunsagensis]|uniref:Ribonuclease H-like domain-containing protein n=1 Tax=Halalkalibacter kiskunsagensis TaxID=1548599 RepID=A0ABV6KDR7_9BACI
MMKNKLNRMKHHMGISGVQQPIIPAKDITKIETIPFEKEWSAFQTSSYWFENEYILIREKQYPLSHQHGRYSLSDTKDIVYKWHDHLYSHPLSTKGRKVEELIFFDTETTGLSSGVGNSIFMLGYCQIKSNCVRVKQYFLPGPESEVAFYHHFLTDVGELGSLVTYNGKAFDWPQVKTRHTFVRDQVPSLPKFGHFDLLHATRRMYKDALPSCKLSIVEKEILLFERVEDTPSYMVPMLYFDFLNEPDPELVKGIFQHHEWDVLSLMSLYTHLSSLILKSESNQVQPRERYEVARWYEAIGEKEIAMHLYEQLMGIGKDTAEASLFAFAKGQKQEQSWRRAYEGFTSLLETKAYMYLAALECSKICEHQFKDFEKAIYYTKLALSDETYLRMQSITKQKKVLADLNQRLKRLIRKSR